MRYLINENFSVTYFKTVIRNFLFIIITAFIAGCYLDKKDSPPTVDMVVVFKMDVPVAKASSILFEKGYIFFEGMDSSKGKEYFRKTGPKYIVKVPEGKISEFYQETKTIMQIYEVYQADWNITKD